LRAMVADTGAAERWAHRRRIAVLCVQVSRTSSRSHGFFPSLATASHSSFCAAVLSRAYWNTWSLVTSRFWRDARVVLRPAAARLGYPDYFLTMLGVAKLLSVVALLAPVPRWLREWAYAGFRSSSSTSARLDRAGAACSRRRAASGRAVAATAARRHQEHQQVRVRRR